MLEKVFLAVQWLPILIQTMKQVEEAIPGQGAGEQKLAAVRGILEQLYSLTGKVGPSFVDIWPVLENIAGTLVKSFNSTGIFSRGSR